MGDHRSVAPLWVQPARERLGDHTPCSPAGAHGHCRLRLEGVSAPAVFDGTIDNPSLLAYIEQVLVRTLRSGDVVVLDNFAVHRPV